jgi:hypothetical protein
LHKESKRVFLQDKTHAHLIFLFSNDGPVSISPVPPKTENAQVHNGIVQAVRQNNLYAVIHIGEAWTYFRKGKEDHTAFQIMDGEMRVADLRAEDKVEVLYLRMESRDGDSVMYLDKIVRDGDSVTLGDGKTINGEERNWF